MRKPSLLFPVAALVEIMGGAAHAQNIVQDPGFESAAPGAGNSTTTLFSAPGDIGDGMWFVTQNNVGVQTTTALVFNGAKSVDLTPGFVTNSLTQTLTTTPGQQYTLSFYANANDPNTFRVTFGGNPVAGAPTSITQNGFPNIGAGSNAGLFTLYTAAVTASAASTALTFTATSNNGIVELDNVSVTPNAVPEPGVCAYVVLVTGGSAGILRRRRRQK